VVADSNREGKASLAALRIDDGARDNPSRSRLGLVLIAAAVVALAIVVALLVLRRPPEVRVAKAHGAQGGGAATLLNASGYVTPRRRATVAAKVTGRVTEVLTDEGMVVKEGQLLATLDDSDVQRRLSSAQTQRDAAKAALADYEVQLANAERELKRQHDLEKDGVTSVQALDLASTAVDSLKARLAVAREQVRVAEAGVGMARQDVDNCSVRAPFAGVVVSKDAQAGEMVSPMSAGGGFTRTGIATIVDMASLEVEVDVNEAYIAKVKPGQRVESTLDAYPDWKIPSSVRTVIPTADRQKATVKVRISFDALDPRILPDMGVKVAFLAEVEPSAAPVAVVVVPTEAVRTDAGTQVIFRAVGNEVERRAVKVGATHGGEVEILAGIAVGDDVVVAGPADLKDGQKIRVKQ
jgi:RND family efflux transporter MFP subunit